MKKIILTLLFVMLVAVPAFAVDTNATTTYKVTIEIVYNAKSPQEAAAIVLDAATKHAGACKNKMTVEKNSFSSGCEAVNIVTYAISQ